MGEGSERDASDRAALGRRAFVGAGLAAAVPGLAGCVSRIGDAPTVDVFVTNGDDTSHTVDVAVAFDGETLLDERFIVDPGREQEGVFQNPGESGDATVSATVRDGGSAERDIPAGRGSGLAAVFVEVVEGGTIETSVTVR